MSGTAASWADVDGKIIAELDRIRSAGGAVRFLSGTVVSPTVKRQIDGFLKGFSGARHIVYDAVSFSAILDAHEKTHGVRAMPRFRLDRADVIVSFDADFLGTWIAPVELTESWQSRRRPTAKKPEMSFHVQIEPRLTVTGSKADHRLALRPSRFRGALTALLAAVGRLAGSDIAGAAGGPGLPAQEITALAERLWKARGQGLVLCGINDLDLQLLTNRINHLLGAYGTTIDLERPSNQAAGNDRELAVLLDELKAGTVQALLVAGVNPAYDLAHATDFAMLASKVPLMVSFACWEDETSRLAGFVCPDNHPLESWGDAEPVAGVLSLAQPAISPLGKTRQLIETLALWSGGPRPARELVRETWRQEVYPRSGSGKGFDSFWNHALQRGVVEVNAPPLPVQPFSETAPGAADSTAEPRGYELVLYPSVAQGSGRQALNPWLHELPDPITKVTWDNVASLAPADARALGVRQGDVVRLKISSADNRAAAVELPVFVQPGQAEGTVAVALGYGRLGTQRFSTIGPEWIDAPPRPASPPPVGVSLAGFIVTGGGGLRRLWRDDVTLTPTGARQPLACTQTHHTLEVPRHLALPGGEVRETVRDMSLAALAAGKVESRGEEPSLWPDDHPYTGHHWALAVDLNACTGCSACVIGCQAENNVPVVGRDEVRRRREMHWIRVDTYFTGEGDRTRAVHQPMMCQQCDNAPCETVCPVLATLHSEEGLSEQVYNRCIGTRYCENNCPYKVRRFNWFNYHKKSGREDLVLNPDVTVRSRGIMEKCSFCVQRIMEAKMEAKEAGRPFADGDVRVACQQSCPAQAIVFGDLNDPKSRIAAMMKDPRRYGVLEELGIRPSVGYLAVVRNEGEAHRG
ncbi:MAG: 4Fe-4S dicluster domain-containing protein [Acidobacteria bacterium]|nr:4Fe-4S dicluster domain-containing protein [Acidobacteriota bacterium]